MNICINCIRDNVLKSKITDAGTTGVCNHCEENDFIISVIDLSEKIDTIFRTYYKKVNIDERTHPGIDAFDLLCEGQDYKDIIYEILDLPEQIHKSVCENLKTNFDEYNPYAQEEAFYDDDSVYEFTYDYMSEHEFKWDSFVETM